MWLNFSWINDMYIYWPAVLIGLTVIIVFLPAPVLYHRSRKWFAFSNVSPHPLVDLNFTDCYSGVYYLLGYTPSSSVISSLATCTVLRHMPWGISNSFSVYTPPTGLSSQVQLHPLSTPGILSMSTLRLASLPVYPPIPGHEECLPSSFEFGQVHIRRALLRHPEHVPHRPPNALPSLIHHIRPTERRLHLSLGPDNGLESRKPLCKASNAP